MLDKDKLPIIRRISQPTPDEVREARIAAGLSQEEAGMIVSPASISVYKTWAGYETNQKANGEKGNHRKIPLGIYELFLLMTDQHPELVVKKRVD